MDDELRAELDAEMKWAFEKAELVYVEAKEAGAIDPVIRFRDATYRMAEEDPERQRLEAECEAAGMMPMDIAWQERSAALRDLAPLPEAAEMVANPRPGYRITVLYEANGSLTIHECVAPEDRD